MVSASCPSGCVMRSETQRVTAKNSSAKKRAQCHRSAQTNPAPCLLHGRLGQHHPHITQRLPAALHRPQTATTCQPCAPATKRQACASSSFQHGGYLLRHVRLAVRLGGQRQRHAIGTLRHQGAAIQVAHSPPAATSGNASPPSIASATLSGESDSNARRDWRARLSAQALPLLLAIGLDIAAALPRHGQRRQQHQRQHPHRHQNRQLAPKGGGAAK
jgi:hypothetical protein